VGESAVELAERALGHTSGDAQATVTRERSLLSRFARSRPTQVRWILEVNPLACKEAFVNWA